MKKARKYIIMGVVLTSILIVTTAFADKYQHVYRKLDLIDKVLNEYYVGNVDTYKLQEGIYKGYVAAIGDAYSSYFTKDEYNSLMEETSGSYFGIGIRMMLDETDNSIVIKEVFDGSPAEEGGLKENDKIVGVAAEKVNGNDFATVSDKIVGEKGTTVAIKIYRPSEDREYTFDVRRDQINYPTVYFKMLDNDMSYIKVTKFEEVTYNQFKEALDASEVNNAKGIILDLRDNPGGLLRMAVAMVDELVPEGPIVTTRDKNGKSAEYKADNKYIDTPMVVIINGNSASASEVVAGALKDYDRVKLVGENSFGKGIVQTIIPLTDGSAIKLTTSQYFTPKGVCIQGIGIKPDVEVKLSAEKILKGSDLEESEDDQLQAAIKTLQEEIDNKASK